MILSHFLFLLNKGKYVPMLNLAPRHGDVWGSGGIAPHILNLGARWRWVVSFTHQPLYSLWKTPGIHWRGGWVVPKASLETVVKRKILNPCQELNPGCPACSQTLHQLSYHGSISFLNTLSFCSTIWTWGASFQSYTEVRTCTIYLAPHLPI
jgi:hypothetical protein